MAANERTARLEVKVDKLQEDMTSMSIMHKENTEHIAILNEEFGKIQKDVAINNKVSWYIFTGIIGIILIQIMLKFLI